nr:hypothetical protein [Tanacetum cinerariifolium]
MLRKLEVIEFGDSYEVPADNRTIGSASDGTGKKKGRTVTLTTDDMQKRKNDVKARTTLLLALPDEHQLRFSKHKTAQELWAAILKTFGGNETTKKTKKNLLKQQYGNFKAEGSETLEQIFNRLHVIDINQINEDDMEEMDIKWNMALLSMRADRFWKKTRKKITIQGTDMAGFDKSKVECFNCHKMGHFARECRGPRSQDKGRRNNYRQGSKVEEHTPKALMEIDGVGWDWSYMANDEENHALVADEEAPTEFALMAKTSVESEVFDNSLCSKACKKNTDSLNSKITELTDKLSDAKNMIYHYKLGLAQVEAKLAEYKNQELKYCEKIKILEFKTESRANCIESLTKELELIKKEKESLDSKLAGFETASKDLDSLLESQRLDKNKEGPSPAIESTSDDAQNKNPSVTETKASPSTISPKPFIKFVKAADRPTENKTDKCETVKKPAVKYAELYRKPSKSSSIRGNQRNWYNLKSHQLGVKMGRSSPKNNYTHRSMPPKPMIHKPFRPPMRPKRKNMNVTWPKRTSFHKPAHSYNKRPFQRTSAVRSQFRDPRVATVNRKFPTANRKFPTVNRKFPTGNTKFSTANMGNKEKAEDARLLVKELSKPIQRMQQDKSGNSNPTATSTKPPADQMKTLTVETPLPAVSSPVLTACLNDSPEPLSDTRLISKRVASQVETPSLDNILTLTNRFEDILRVTTNSVHSDGVEADVSNMETTITASPTPTLRIHKDHPKSQIIGHVDTPIQTRHKSKEAIRLFLAYASFMRFTVYQMDVKSAFLYGTIDEEVEFKALMHEKFQMSVMGELNFFLGLQVLQKEDGIFLSQDKYVDDILKKFRYSDVRSANTPMDKENPWGKDGTGKDVDLHHYRSMIGSLLYLTASRPDIMFAVCTCARHQVTPKECHLHAVNRIFRYLKGYLKLGLWYPKESLFDLVAYLDSDYGGASQDRKSTTRGCLFLGTRLISWQCKKQTIVTTSTTEAEYVAAAIKNPVYHFKTKHIEIRHHFIRDCFEKKLISVDHIHTDENVADLLIKPFDAGRFQYLVDRNNGRGNQDSRYRRRRARIAQSSALPPVADEPASPLRDVSEGDTCPTDSGFAADQDRANIAKTSTLPYESTSRVTSLAADEGSMQHKLDELMALCTSLQRQQSEMVSKFEAQELEINSLKARIKQLEDNDSGVADQSGDDALIKGRSLDEGEEAAERVSDDTEEMATVLTSMDAASILTSGGVQVVSTAAEVATTPVSIPTGSGVVSTASLNIPTASPIFTTTTESVGLW